MMTMHPAVGAAARLVRHRQVCVSGTDLVQEQVIEQHVHTNLG
jgi:hypothetical protein